MNDNSRILHELLKRAGEVARVGAFVYRLRPAAGATWSDTLYEIVALPRGAPPSRRDVLEIFPAAFVTLLDDAVRRMQHDPQPLEVDVPLRPAPGRAAWVRLYLAPRHEAGACVEISGALQDVTERKRLEMDLLTATQSERQRIGAELHDDLGQILTGAGLQAEALYRSMRSAGADGRHVEHLDGVRAALQSARDACRRLAHSHVDPVSPETFARLMRNLPSTVPESIACEVRVDPLPATAPPGTFQDLMRIAQEAVANAVKHARCSRIRIAYDVREHSVELSVEDDGAGCAPDAPLGLGSSTMRARAARIGGVLQTGPGANGGTRVAVVLARHDVAQPADLFGAPAPAGVLRLEWRADFRCGEPMLDRQHERLFVLANAVLDAAGGADDARLRTALDRLLEHVIRHFADEEALLARRGYANLESHAAAHARLVARALELKTASDGGRAAFGDLVDFLANQIVATHLFTADRDFYPLFAR
jgi:hemerythrin-like metal-binding protein